MQVTCTGPRIQIGIQIEIFPLEYGASRTPRTSSAVKRVGPTASHVAFAALRDTHASTRGRCR